MAKVSLTKLKLETGYDEIETVDWNEEKIEVKKYLPMKEKLALITKIVNETLDNNDFCNDCRFQIFYTIDTIAAYTNINITDKQREDVYKLYDMFVNSGLEAVILDAISADDIAFIREKSRKTIEQIYTHRCSAAGIMQSLVDDYGKAKIDINKLSEEVKSVSADENFAFLKEVIEKLG